MKLAGPASAGTASLGVEQAAQNGPLAQQAKRLVGTLWYDVLSDLSATSMSSETRGSGQSAFRSMFLWNIAQNDFGKYGSTLVSAIERQAAAGSGRGGPAAAAPPRAPAPASAPASASVSGLDQMEFVAADANAGASSDALGFARRLWPGIKVAASMLGIPPVGLLAQAALESAWGAAAPGNNYFGIKSAGGEASSFRSTHEMIMGQLVPTVDSFRDYTSAGASLEDYVSLIRSNFPGVVGQGSVEGFANALQSGGYATDSSYAAKILSIARSPMMGSIMSMLSASDGAAMQPEPSPSP